MTASLRSRGGPDEDAGYACCSQRVLNHSRKTGDERCLEEENRKKRTTPLRLGRLAHSFYQPGPDTLSSLKRGYSHG